MLTLQHQNAGRNQKINITNKSFGNVASLTFHTLRVFLVTGGSQHLLTALIEFLFETLR
jgi:hypothetical protein